MLSAHHNFFSFNLTVAIQIQQLKYFIGVLDLAILPKTLIQKLSPSSKVWPVNATIFASVWELESSKSISWLSYSIVIWSASRTSTPFDPPHAKVHAYIHQCQALHYQQGPMPSINCWNLQASYLLGDILSWEYQVQLHTSWNQWQHPRFYRYWEVDHDSREEFCHLFLGKRM